MLHRKRRFTPLFLLLLILGTSTLTLHAQWKWANNFPTGNDLYAVAYRATGTAVAVGELGVIVVTTDDGTTWKAVETEARPQLNGVAFVNDSIVIAVGDSGTIARSSDAGRNWKWTTTPTLTSIAGISVSRSRIWIAAGNTLFVSDDTGINWSARALDSGVYSFSVDAISDSTVWVGCDSNVVLHSSDGGRTWNRDSVFAVPKRHIQYYQITHADASHMWIWGSDDLNGEQRTYHTTDGGRFWKLDSIAFPLFNFSDSRHVWALHNEALSISTDFGAHWKGSQLRPPHTSVWYNTVPHALAAADSFRAIVVGMKGSIFRSIDGATSSAEMDATRGVTIGAVLCTNGVISVIGPYVPERFVPVLGPHAHYVDTLPSWGDAYFVDSLHGWVSGQRPEPGSLSGPCAVWHTSDGGKSWIMQLGDSSWKYTGPGMWFFDTLHGFAAGYEPWYPKSEPQCVFVTADGGATWDSIAFACDFIRRIAFTTPRIGWVVAADSLECTTDGGASWVSRWHPSVLSAGDSKGMFVFDSLDLWLAGDGLAHTRDGGRTWDSMPAPPSNGGQSIFFINRDTGWCAGEDLYRTTDGGATWIRENIPTRGWNNIFSVDNKRIWVNGYGGDLMYLDLEPPSRVNPGTPQRASLLHAYPNPAATSITIECDHAVSGWVHCDVSDIAGRTVRTFIEHLSASDANGLHIPCAGLTNGTYHATIRGDGIVQDRMFNVVR